MDINQLRNQQKIMTQDLDSVKNTLSKIPNVIAVGIGLKESKGKFTEEISYRIFVSKKKSESTLKAGEIIPPAFNGIKTDVLNPLIITDDSDVCGVERRTTAKERPIMAGIAISTDSDSYGTLGWFGKLNSDNTPILLTNKHVLYDSTNSTDSGKLKVAQSYLGEVTKCCCCECGSDDAIGEAIIGIRDISPASDTSVDCAIAKINTDIASSMKLEITNASTTQVLKVKGTEAAQVGDNVRKIGARSGFTKGVVVHLGDLATTAATDPNGGTIVIRQGQVLIIPANDETYEVKEGTCKKAFSNSGDSGAVVLNDNDKIIALNWGGDRTTNSVAISVANNISNVLSKLSSNGFPITLSVSPEGGDNEFLTKQIETARKSESTNVWKELRDTNKGSVLYQLVERHFKEVTELINHNRAVTVTWQRNHGPSFVAAFNRAGKIKDYSIPAEIQGITIKDLHNAMEKILYEHGSMDLRKDLDNYSEFIKNAVESQNNLRDITEALIHFGLLDNIPGRLIRLQEIHL
jgi:hypothetical protein